MYSFIIIETDTSYEARITRIMLETAGYPTIAATLRVDDHEGYIAITAAPADVPAQYAEAIRLYATLGEKGVKRATELSAVPMAKRLQQLNPRAVPADKRDAIRNALLHTLYTAAPAEHITVVTSEPSYSAVPVVVADAPTVKVTRDPLQGFTPDDIVVGPSGQTLTQATKNPAGGGFDGQCRGADRWRENHDSGDEHHSPDRYDYWTSPT